MGVGWRPSCYVIMWQKDKTVHARWREEPAKFILFSGAHCPSGDIQHPNTSALVFTWLTHLQGHGLNSASFGQGSTAVQHKCSWDVHLRTWLCLSFQPQNVSFKRAEGSSAWFVAIVVCDRPNVMCLIGGWEEAREGSSVADD